MTNFERAKEIARKLSDGVAEVVEKELGMKTPAKGVELLAMKVFADALGLPLTERVHQVWPTPESLMQFLQAQFSGNQAED
jgi:hypothetical protein